MKRLSNAIDRFCQRRPNFGIPRLMLWIVIANAAVYLLTMMDRTGLLLYYLYFNPILILQGQLWRLVTFVFIPVNASNPIFLLLSLYFYYFIGSTLEKQWGKGKFTIYYLSGVLFTVIYAMFAGLLAGASYIGITAYYINLSMFFVFATYYPEHRVLLFFFIPIKIKWLALVDALFFIYEIVVTPFPLNMLPILAALNILLFCLDDIISLFRTDHQSNVRRINFRREATAARQKEANRSFRHRCEVCGRTEKDFPDLEFRYCSRCQGYHCFCSDHIYNHSHRTE